MFCTFTTEHGTFILRTQDVRRLEDTPAGCTLAFAENDHLCYITIVGTTTENLARLKEEELAVMTAAQQLQQRQQQGYPMLPIPRGKVAR